MNRLICTFGLVLLVSVGPAHSGTVNEILTDLQESHSANHWTFVEQDEIGFLIAEGGGGPCASSAGSIALQTMRLMAGLDKCEHPHRAVLESLKDQKQLLGGRVTNLQFAKLLKFYEKYLDGEGVEVAMQSAPNSPYAVGKDAWPSSKGPDLSEAEDAFHILAFTWTTEAGEVLGRHFVLLKHIDDGVLSVVDPAAPTKKRQFKLEKAESGRILLRRPDAPNPGNATFELNTVFTVKLMDKAKPDSVKEVKAVIDATAFRLRKQGLLRSPRHWRQETAAAGLPALDLPLDLGGANWPAEKMLEVFRHAGRYDLNLRDVVGGAHGRVLLKSSTPEVRDVLRNLANGEGYMAISITEPTHGSDFTAIQTVATKVDGGYRLTGEKKFNARLDQATHVVVFTKAANGKPKHLSAFLLPIDAEGVTVTSFGAHGLYGNSFGGMKLDSVFVPDTHLIGEDGDGYTIFNDHFRYWRLMQTAAAIGTAERALEMMAGRLLTRKVYGKPIGSFTHLQQPLGQYHTQLAMAHALAVQAAKLFDQGRTKEADVIICGLKAEGVEVALAAVDACVRAYGAEGYSDLVDVGGRLQDLNGLRIADGATDVMRSAVVSKVYGKDFWDMAFKQQSAGKAVDD